MTSIWISHNFVLTIRWILIHQLVKRAHDSCSTLALLQQIHKINQKNLKHVEWAPSVNQSSAALNRARRDEQSTHPCCSSSRWPLGKKAQKQEVDQVLAVDVIEWVQTDLASLSFIVSKKDGTLHICVYYRNLSTVTTQDLYLIPFMADCVVSFGDSTISLTINATGGYWQMKSSEEHCNKIAFTSFHGISRFAWVPYVLKHAPETFKWAMDVLSTKYKRHFALSHFNNIVMFSHTPDNHIGVRQVLTLFHEIYVTLNVGNKNFSRIALIILAMVFALSAPKYPHARFTPYLDSNSRHQWRNNDHI